MTREKKKTGVFETRANKRRCHPLVDRRSMEKARRLRRKLGYNRLEGDFKDLAVHLGEGERRAVELLI